MAATPVAFSTLDNAQGTLASGINASVLTIPLQTGDGAAFPQPYTGSATSLGSSTTLNSTGISAAVGGSAVLGKWIWNKTDGSVAVITAVATDAITTTRLLGGSDNTWQSADVWCIDPFVATFAILDVDGNITTSEEALITARSTDTLTVPTGGRGYNGTIANSFDTGDSVYLLVTSPIVERMKDIESVLGVQVNTNVTNIATNTTNITNLQTGAYDYVVATGSANAYVVATPALAAYAAGNYVEFKANFSNTGAATINVNGLGATSIKKNDGATALIANDIISGQIVRLRYDGTNFQMLSPVGTPATVTHYAKSVYLGASDSSSGGSGIDTRFVFDTHTYEIPANDLIAGVGYEVEAIIVTAVSNATTFTGRVGIGSTDFFGVSGTSASGGGPAYYLKGIIMGTAAAGASVAVRGMGLGICDLQLAGDAESGYGTANLATNGALTINISGQFSATNGGTAILKMLSVKKISTTAF